MTLSVKTDQNWPGGGFALLSGEGLDGVTAVTIESCLSKQLLSAQGTWGKFPHPFPVAQTPSGALMLGPDIVDHVPTELFILLRDQTGVELGKLFWVDVMPSRNPGSATPADVLAIHRRSAGIASKPIEAPWSEPETVAISAPPPPSSAVAPPPDPPREIAPPPPLPAAKPTSAPAPPPPPRASEPPPPVLPPPPLPVPPRTDIAAISPDVALRLMPRWLTLTLAGVFSSSLLLVVLIVAGIA